MSRPSRSKKLIRILVPFVLGALLLVLMAPTIASWTFGSPVVAGIIQRQVDGRVSVGATSFGWFSSQEISGILVRDDRDECATSIKADVVVDRSLSSLLLHGLSGTSIDIKYMVTDEIGEDGLPGLVHLFNAPETSPDGSDAAPSQGESGSAGGDSTIPDLDITADGSLSLAAIDGRRYDMSSTMKLSLSTSSTTTVSFTVDAADEGRMTLDAELANAFDSNGRPDLASAGLRCTADASDITIPIGEDVLVLDSMALSIDSTSLGKGASLEMDSDGRYSGGDRSTVSASIDSGGLVGTDGRFRFDTDAVNGTIRASRFPAALLQLAFIDTPIDAQRDFGPAVDLDVTASGIDTRTLAASLSSPRTSIRLSASRDRGGHLIVGDSLELKTGAIADIVASLLETKVSGSSTGMITLDSFSIRLPDDDSIPGIGDVSFKGRLSLDGDLELVDVLETAPVTITDVGLSLESVSLLDSLVVTGSAKVDSTTIDIRQELTGLMSRSGRLSEDWYSRIDGTINLDGITPGTVATFSGQAPSLLEAALPTSSRMLATFAPARPGDGRSGLSASIKLTGSGLDFSCEVQGDPAGTVGLDLSGRYVMRPVLVSMLQDESDDPVQLVSPASLGFRLDRIEIPVSSLGDGSFSPPDITGAIDCSEIMLDRLPSVTGQLRVKDVDLEFSMHEQELSSLQITSTVMDADGSKILKLDASGSITPDEETASRTDAIITADLVSIEGIEELLGTRPGTFVDLLGGRGSINGNIKAIGTDARFDIDLRTPQFDGSLSGTASTAAVELDPTTVNLKIPPANLDRIAEAGAGPGTVGAFKAPMDISASIDGFRVPTALFRNEPFPADQCVFKLALSVSPFTLDLVDAGNYEFTDSTAMLNCDDLSSGIRLDIRSSAAGDHEGTTSLSVRGSATRLIDDDGAIDTSTMRLDLDSVISSFPTPLVDILADTGGKLTSALGATVNATAKAVDLSRDTGTFLADLDSREGSLSVPGMKFIKGIATLEGDAPITGKFALSESMREELLALVNPIFSDLTVGGDLVDLSIPALSMPVDSDWSRLNGLVKFKFGEVQFQTKGVLNGFLKLTGTSQADRFPGTIEPLTINMVDGIVFYDDLVFNVGRYGQGYKYSITSTGRIDLTGKVPMVDRITAKFPAESFANSVKELRQVPPSILNTLSVQVVWSGPLLDEQGRRLPLKEKIELPDLGDILKDPEGVGNLIKGIFDIIEKNR